MKNAKISLTSIGITFMIVTVIFVGFFYSYGIASVNGYNTTGLNESFFNEIGNETLLYAYINDSGKTITEDTTADLTSFDIIGNMIATSLAPVKTIISGATFLTSNIGKLLAFVGVPLFIAENIIGIIIFVVGSIFLFKVILGRSDKLD